MGGEHICGTLWVHVAMCIFHCSEAAVEEDLRYMLQPSRIYVGESVNVFQRGEFAFISQCTVLVFQGNYPCLYLTLHSHRFFSYGASRDTPTSHSRKTYHLWWSEWQHWYVNSCMTIYTLEACHEFSLVHVRICVCQCGHTICPVTLIAKYS